MDRRLISAGAIPLETDLLQAQKNAYVALGDLARAVLGTGFAVEGLQVQPTSPVSLGINVLPGAVYVQDVVDQNAFSSLGADLTHATVIQGRQADTKTFATPAPVVSGQSVVYLVQAALAVTDDHPVTRPYYNAADPDTAWEGPNNSGASEFQDRLARAVVTVKSGLAATTGTQVAPTPDPGCYGLYTVTVANGQASVLSTHITRLSTATFIPAPLPVIPLAVQDNRWTYAEATGTANALAITLTPQPPSLVRGMRLHVYAPSTNTGAATLTVAGFPARAIQGNGQPLLAGAIIGSTVIDLDYDGTAWQLRGLSRLPEGALVHHCVDTSPNANVVLGTLIPAISAYAEGLVAYVTIANTNTANVLADLGFGSLPVVKFGGTQLASGDIAQGVTAHLYCTGAAWQLMNPPPGTSTGGGGGGSATDLDITTMLTPYWGPTVISATLTTPPSSPVAGDTYLVPHTGASGAWSGHADQLTQWTGTAWVFRAYPLGTPIGVRGSGSTLADILEKTASGTTPWVSKFATSASLSAGTQTRDIVSSKLLADAIAAIPLGTGRTTVTASMSLPGAGWYFIDASAGTPITVTLPASPAGEPVLTFSDPAMSWDANPPIVDPNGASIDGGTTGETLICMAAGATFSIVYRNSGWELI